MSHDEDRCPARGDIVELHRQLDEALAEAWCLGFDAGHEHARAVNAEWPNAPRNPYARRGEDVSDLGTERTRHLEARAVRNALLDAADELGRLVDEQHPDAVNPDQWLRDRADALEGDR